MQNQSYLPLILLCHYCILLPTLLYNTYLKSGTEALLGRYI